MCAAAVAAGQSILEGAAREPEIVDLGGFLNRLGAESKGSALRRSSSMVSASSAVAHTE